jgi:hypothetical protein
LNSQPSPAPHWYAIDFGKPVNLARAELAFFEDKTTFAAPDRVTLEYWRDGRWKPLASARPVANGITRIDRPARQVSRIRALMSPAGGRAMRLIELKAISDWVPHGRR